MHAIDRRPLIVITFILKGVTPKYEKRGNQWLDMTWKQASLIKKLTDTKYNNEFMIVYIPMKKKRNLQTKTKSVLKFVIKFPYGNIKTRGRS